MDDKLAMGHALAVVIFAKDPHFISYSLSPLYLDAPLVPPLSSRVWSCRHRIAIASRLFLPSAVIDMPNWNDAKSNEEWLGVRSFRPLVPSIPLLSA
jgi:hypothetical protein